MIFYILDEREVWHEHIAAAALNCGFKPVRIKRGSEVNGPGWGFIRPHAEPKALTVNKEQDWYNMNASLNMVQDINQVQLYDDKIGQMSFWSDIMPETWFITKNDISNIPVTYPVVSKATEGASSVNVRILKDNVELTAHLNALFSEKGVPISHCDGGPGHAPTKGRQQGYALLQEFIPHDRTYRVNIIGGGRAVFERYNYKDRNVAQTGNVRPWMEVERPELLEFADMVADYIGTKWAALDILERPGGGFVLLETSLAWPWQKGQLSDTPIFNTDFNWGQLWYCMFEEIVYK